MNALAGKSYTQSGTNIKNVRIPEPCIVVIFGASGDLTRRKLLPAIYHLGQSGLLPDDFAVVGVAPFPKMAPARSIDPSSVQTVTSLQGEQRPAKACTSFAAIAKFRIEFSSVRKFA
jgi:glucose-6-phosphate 1-dehydrogenase